MTGVAVEDTYSIEADRTFRGLKDVTAESCVEQFEAFAKKYHLSDKGRQDLLNLSTEIYLNGNLDLQYFIREIVGISIDRVKYKERIIQRGLKTLYDKIRPKHKIIFE